uniref:FTP domain-containing protein n=1 Tax=Macrostomum lignano TaxID=282301 RepID=A0A1I8J2T0_9PLAT
MEKSILLLFTLLNLLFVRLDGRSVLMPKFLPAKISSQHTSGQSAELAYNGNTDGHYVDAAQCVLNSGSDTVPWWMLDLLQSYRIAGVNVWNRLDSTDEVRFTQISLGISSDAAAWSSFSENLFKRCFYFTGAPTDATNPISLTCPSPVVGRYLALYKNRTGLTAITQAYFNFCEVDVYVAVPDNEVANAIQPSYSMTSISLIAALTQMRSDIECLLRCSQLTNCLFVLFRTATLECWLFQSTVIPSSFAAVAGNADAKLLALYNN